MEEMTMSEFHLVPPRERMALMLGGKVKLIDDPPKPPPPRPEGSVLRSHFNTLNAKEKWDIIMVQKKILYDDL